MATTVLDFDINKMPKEIKGLGHYSRVLILLRYNGHPIGQLILPAPGNSLSWDELSQALIDATQSIYWEKWIQESLRFGERVLQNPNPSVTIAICTHDRAEDLRRCLQGLTILPDQGQKIIVIDSNPSNAFTRAVVTEYEDVQYFQEEVPGINRARNRALQEAQTDLVAFIDDDAIPDPNWLRSLTCNFDDPTVAMVTGLTMPLELETEAQELFEFYSPFNRGFQRIVFDQNNLNPLTIGNIGAGVNMAVRRQLIDELGGFDEALDAGTPMYSGGEAELFIRVLSRDHRIVYDPDALNWHRRRRSREELRQTVYGYGVGIYAFWAQKLIVDKEFSVVFLAVKWFFQDQLPALLRSLLGRPDHKPMDLILLELKGCIVGPWAYLCSRHQLRTKA
jgi:GT2 family glycosyltransferase